MAKKNKKQRHGATREQQAGMATAQGPRPANKRPTVLFGVGDADPHVDDAAVGQEDVAGECGSEGHA